MLKSKYTSKHALYFLTICVLTFLLIFGIEAQKPIDILEYGVKVDTGQPRNDYDPNIASLAVVEYDKYRVTGFSSVECKTTWCNANAGEPRGQKVALNSKYGKVKQIYIPKYDKTYEVIGTTDYKTDLDIWFGDDYKTALEQGLQYLDLEFIY